MAESKSTTLSRVLGVVSVALARLERVTEHQWRIARIYMLLSLVQTIVTGTLLTVLLVVT